MLWLVSLWNFALGRVIAGLPCTKVVSAQPLQFPPSPTSPSDLVCPAFVMPGLKYFKLFSRMPANDSSLECCPVSGSSPVSRLSLHKLVSPGLSLLVSLSVLWLQCMLEDVVLMGCNSILQKEGWLHFIQIGFSLLPPGSLLTLSCSALKTTEVLWAPCVSAEAGAKLLHSKSCLIPH